jgi:hypothetical protein
MELPGDVHQIRGTGGDAADFEANSRRVGGCGVIVMISFDAQVAIRRFTRARSERTVYLYFSIAAYRRPYRFPADPRG